jgi:3-oxoadipate enol-lactonase/4-carboxymuconolactone decarboxylase
MTIPILRGSITPAANGAVDAELLVLGPSLGTTIDVWRLTLPDISQHYRVLRFDLPGHGLTPAARSPFTMADLASAVVALVDSAGGGLFHYAGVSLGGAIGLHLALEHPERLRSLTVLSTGAVIADPGYWAERASFVRSNGTAAMVTGSSRVWFAPGFSEREPDLAGAALNELTEVDDESYALCCEALAGHDVTGRLHEIQARTLAVASTRDTATPEAGLRFLSDRITHARFRLIDGAAHLPMLERPGTIARLVVAHCDGRDAVDEALFAGFPSSADRNPVDRERGMAVRRAVLGDDHVDASIAKTTPETADFQDFITRYAWGEIWARPGLDRRSRSLITLAALIAGNHPAELAMHVRAALRGGVTRAEISEAILHTALYAGLPAANNAFAIARDVFADVEETGS